MLTGACRTFQWFWPILAPTPETAKNPYPHKGFRAFRVPSDFDYFLANFPLVITGRIEAYDGQDLRGLESQPNEKRNERSRR